MIHDHVAHRSQTDFYRRIARLWYKHTPRTTVPPCSSKTLWPCAARSEVVSRGIWRAGFPSWHVLVCVDRKSECAMASPDGRAGRLELGCFLHVHRRIVRQPQKPVIPGPAEPSNYLADAYETFSSSAQASQSWTRNVLGGVFPLFAYDMVGSSRVIFQIGAETVVHDSGIRTRVVPGGGDRLAAQSGANRFVAVWGGTPEPEQGREPDPEFQQHGRFWRSGG